MRYQATLYMSNNALDLKKENIDFVFSFFSYLSCIVLISSSFNFDHVLKDLMIAKKWEIVTKTIWALLILGASLAM